MLGIYIYGDKESGYLDLIEKQSLSMEKVYEWFDDELTTGEFSLPLDIPWTDKNKRLLHFANVLRQNSNDNVNSFFGNNKEWLCDVYADGIPAIQRGKLTILGMKGGLSYRYGVFNCSIAGRKGVFGNMVAGKKIRTLNLGEVTWSGMNSRQFATAWMKKTPQQKFMAFAPVAILDFFDKDGLNYNDEFLVKDTVNYPIKKANGSWLFGRPDPERPHEEVAQSSVLNNDYRTVPFFNLKYIARNIMQQLNYSISGSFFEDAAYDNLFLFNNVGIENYYQNADITRRINIAEHLPDITVLEFLRGVAAISNSYIEFPSAGSIIFSYKDNLLRSRDTYSITHLCGEEFEITREENKELSYTITYDWDGEDGYKSEVAKDVKDKILIANVLTREELVNVSAGRQLTTNDIAYVRAENIYYTVANATTTPVVWEPYAEKMGDYRYGEGDNAITLPISTLCQYIYEDKDAGIHVRPGYLATQQRGSYISAKAGKIFNNFGLRIFYVDFGSAQTPPSTYNYRYNDNGGIREMYSLSLNSENSLVNKMLRWVPVSLNTETISVDVYASRKEEAAIKNAALLELNGVVFLPEKIEEELPSSGMMKLHLRAIDN